MWKAREANVRARGEIWKARGGNVSERWVKINNYYRDCERMTSS
jgi:hypothetical protein